MEEVSERSPMITIMEQMVMEIAATMEGASRS
jgi:hypothetical protein